MNDKFDELAKGLAQSVTRRGALKKFGAGLAGVVLASLGLANKANAGHCLQGCKHDCQQRYKRNTPEWELCVSDCELNNCS